MAAWATGVAQDRDTKVLTGVILRTTDGGASWTIPETSDRLDTLASQPPYGSDEPLLGRLLISATTASDAWVCTPNVGVISVSVASKTGAPSAKIVFPDGTKASGTIAGGCIEIQAIKGAPATTVYMIAQNDHSILEPVPIPQNGGTPAITSFNIPLLGLFGEQTDPVSFAAFDAQHVWVTDGNFVASTATGPQDLLPPDNDAILGGTSVITAVDAYNAYALGNSVLFTTDGGATWNAGLTPAYTALCGSCGLAALAPLNLLAIGSAAPSGGTLFISSLNPAKWNPIGGTSDYEFITRSGSRGLIAQQVSFIYYPPSQKSGPFYISNLSDFCSPSSSGADSVAAYGVSVEPAGSAAWALGHCANNDIIVSRTTDGMAWGVVANLSTTGQNSASIDVSGSIVAISSNSAWVVVNSSGSTSILRTNDGGATFTEAAQPNFHGKCGTPRSHYIGASVDCSLSIGAYDSLRAWVGSLYAISSIKDVNGTIWYTQDGGASWTPQSDFGVDVQSITVVNESVVWLAGNAGILKTVTAGN
jgi:photosystem II stability/assembly factor-like uncharacterized protein